MLLVAWLRVSLGSLFVLRGHTFSRGLRTEDHAAELLGFKEQFISISIDDDVVAEAAAAGDSASAFTHKTPPVLAVGVSRFGKSRRYRCSRRRCVAFVVNIQHK